ncbi:adenylate cyclase [Spirochaetia bacterium]|nr:adenylate cyclase [Spirochaetia bacterium]
MRILKIGRSSSNDIVVSDPAVSSQHAVISVSDTGEVRLKDLNSKNGTFVNGRRIYQETLITAKDVVKAGNCVVNWQKHLNAPKPVRQFPVIDASAIKQKKTIGRNPGNDIVVSYNDVSGSHAQLIEKANGDITIADSGSTNGTYVNGRKISLHVLKPGDAVMLANKYPFDWSSVFPRVNQEQYLPKDNVQQKTNRTKTLLIAAAVMVVLAAGFLAVKKPWETQGSALFAVTSVLSPEEIYARYKKSVVLIIGAYCYKTSVNGETLGYYSLDYKGDIVQINSDDDDIFYTGTGFIVSNDGKIITNRHVAVPWDYDDDVMAEIKSREQRKLANSSRYRHLVSEVKVEGNLDLIGCFVNDTHVSGLEDLIRCTFIKTSASKDIDVAVLQINSKTLPAGVERIVDLNQAEINDDVLVVGSPVFTIGFPAGFDLGMTTQGIQANNQEGKITQLRGDFEFGHNIAVEHGASGSPVFNQYGKLIGIINAGYEGKQGYNMAIKAKYAVELVK